VLIDQRFERAAALVIFVRISCARRVEALCALTMLDRSYFVRLNEDEFRRRINKATDQPGWEIVNGFLTFRIVK
jgi:hypothetical protein